MTMKPVLSALLLTLGATATLSGPLSAHERGMGARAGQAFDFTGLDTDGDGAISQAEFNAGRQARIEGLDADGDGLISADELAAQMSKQMQARIEAMAEARVREQDLNGDGKLSAAEMAAPRMAGRLFARADTDGDGSVSAEEIAAMQSRMAERQAKHMRKGWRRSGGHGMMDHRMGGHGALPFGEGDDGAAAE